MRGLSVRNLEYMRQFAASWPDSQIPPQPVAQLPWGHIRCLLDKADDRAARLWYAQSAVEDGWSRKLLEHHIATARYEREGKALTNFSSTLPAPESELVQRIVHEDYNFEFLGLAGDVHERRLVLCASRNETVARYALNGIDRPVGVARYTPTPTLAEQVPEELHNQLPELAEISAGVQLIVDRHADEVEASQICQTTN